MTTAVFKAYKVTDGGVTLIFVLTPPAPGQEELHTVMVTDDEVKALKNAADFKALIEGKAKRKMKGNGLASILDTSLGMTVSF
jgi:hypothetical protein